MVDEAVHVGMCVGWMTRKFMVCGVVDEEVYVYVGWMTRRFMLVYMGWMMRRFMCMWGG